MELLREIAFSKRIVVKEAGELKVGDVLQTFGRIIEVIDRDYVVVLKFQRDGGRLSVPKQDTFEVII